MKICSRCGVQKNIDAFWIDRRRNQPKSTCKPCGVMQAREWRRRNPDHEKSRYAREKTQTRERHLKRKYGVTLADYDRMLSDQGGCCAICRSPEVQQFNGVLHVDHDHKTGSVRGLLCRGCNHMLGVVKDDPKILARAIRYLVPQVAAEIIKAYMEAKP